jgi:hypothetical protein
MALSLLVHRLPLMLSSLVLAGAAAAAELPTDVRITYDVMYGSSGMLRVGRADQHWHLEGGRYTLSTELAPVFGPTIRYQSAGRVTDAGLVPESFAEYRNKEGAPRVRAEFDWAKQEAVYGKPDEHRTVKLEPGAQDVNALAFQLAWLGERAAGSLQVLTGKNASMRRFAAGSRTQVTVNGQRTEAQPWRSGDSGARTEVWLAPQLGNLPVRVVRTEDDKELQLVAKDLHVTR